MSGESGCSNPCFLDGHCEGAFLEISFLDSQDKCLQRCKQSDRCQYFNFNLADNSCILLEDCVAIVDTDCKVISYP